MASKCRKFVPNMFNKTKCQACFGSKEAHSAAALDNNKAIRKVSKCGYLFVAPNFDFSNPLDRTRRWQRRFFRLYDDGELTFCVDDHMDTVPQGSVDMNNCTDILEAEVITSHCHSLAVVTPDKTEYIKADSKEETQWWHDVLVKFPNSLKALKTRRKPNYVINSNKENVKPTQNEENAKKPSSGPVGVKSDSAPPSQPPPPSSPDKPTTTTTTTRSPQQQPPPPSGDSSSSSTADQPAAYSTFRGVRSLKHNKSAKDHHQEGLRKSSSLHDLTCEDKGQQQTSLASSPRFLSCSGDQLDSLDGDDDVEGPRTPRKKEEATVVSGDARSVRRLPRNSCPSSLPSGSSATTSSHSSVFASSSSSSSSSSPSSRSPSGSRSLVERSGSTLASRSKSGDQVLGSIRDASVKSGGLADLSTPALSLLGSGESRDRRGSGSTSAGGGASAALLRQEAADDLTQSMSADEMDSNETDELKVARSSELGASSRVLPSPAPSCTHEASSPPLEDLAYMKKGWLIKQTSSDRELGKHWFVLAGSGLSYYQDAKAEESKLLDGCIDLSTCYEVSEVTTPRNYGIKIKTCNGDHTLAAMTAGIRSNWMKAVRQCVEKQSSSQTKTPIQTKTPSQTGKTPAPTLSPHTAHDLDTSPRASALTTATPGAKGETAFQLVGRRDPGRDPVAVKMRRHPSEAATASSGSAVASSSSSSSASASCLPGDGPKLPPQQQHQQPAPSDHGAENKPPSASPSTNTTTTKPQRFSSSSSAESDFWPPTSLTPLRRYVEGCDNEATAPSPSSSPSSSPAAAQTSAEIRRSERNMASERTSKEEEKRDAMTLLAKSPSTRLKEKSRTAKTPRLHSPPAPGAEAFMRRRSSGSAVGDSSSQVVSISDEDNELNLTISSEENYHSCVDNQDCDSLGEGSLMVEILESEVESLKERLDQTQSELVQMHETNMDLKTRLQKETAQATDSSYDNGRWSQSSSQQPDASQTQKRQLKEARDTVQKQHIEIDSLKAKLDMSASKLTGTEKALSEALRECKQEKDKVLKMSAEWTRRLRSLEGQVKDGSHNQERVRQSLLTKERECRRLETEAKMLQQKTREQDRHILQLKAVESEYNQLKEQLHNRDRDLHSIHSQLHERDSLLDKMRGEFEQQMREMEREFRQERDDLENHLEELKTRLHAAEDQQGSREKNMTSNMADLLREKDDIIAQLEEKLIEHDSKMVDMQEELQAEMGENSDLAHNLELVQQEKVKLQGWMSTMETQDKALRTQLGDLEKDNAVFKQKLEKTQQENLQLSTHLKQASSSSSSSSSDPEKLALEKTVQDLREQIQGLQLKLMERLEDLDSSPPAGSEQEDIVHNILVLESDLQDINHLLDQLQTGFHTYVSSLNDEAKQEASSLAKMVKEIGQRCSLLQGSLQESSLSMAPDSGDYHHTIMVTAASTGSVILQEYHGLKKKFDRVVAEAKKLKKEVGEVGSPSHGDREEDRKLHETVRMMEKTYAEQVKSLGQRVDSLTQQLTGQPPADQTPPSTKRTSDPSPGQQQKATDTDQSLRELDSRIQVMEQTLAHASSPQRKSHSIASVPKSPVMASRLQELCGQLDSMNKDINDIFRAEGGPVGYGQRLVSRLDECRGQLSRLAHASHEEGKAAKRAGHEDASDSSCVSVHDASSMRQCLQTIMDKLQEIGEQLDCIEDNNDDSDDGDDDDDDDDEGEETTSIDEVREHLASLCEFVKQHSTFSDLDWRTMQLVTAQKAVISADRQQARSLHSSNTMQLVTAQKAVISADRQQAGSLHSSNTMNKLRAFADRLSLEAVILVEMAHLLEKKKAWEEKDPVLQEMSVLNSQILSLHQKLEQEMRTMNLTEPAADVLRVQADIMAEKILVEGHLCSAALSAGEGSKEESTEEEKSVHPKLLAAEAILRSQLDSFIGHNLDVGCDELWSSASHLTTRSLIQGELTFALTFLKKRLADSVKVTASVSSVRELYLQRLKDRHSAVMEVAEAYRQRMTQAFAAIIFKESADLTLMEGSGSVLDTVCSEISSTMETHIQHCKVKVRSAGHTLTAHCWDMVVSKLREDRDLVLADIRRCHAACVRSPAAQTPLDVPCQSLDTSISSFGEIVSLRSILSAHLQFLLQQLKLGDAGLRERMEVEGEGEGAEQRLQSGLCSFVHCLAEALKEQAEGRRSQVQNLMLADKDITAASIPNIPHPKATSPYSDVLIREAVFAAQTTFMMYKLKLLHDQEMEAVKVAHPARRYKPLADSQHSSRDLAQTFAPLENMVGASHSDEVERLRAISSQVERLRGVAGAKDWRGVEGGIQELDRRVREEVKRVEKQYQAHLGMFAVEQKKVEQVVEELRRERDHLEECCAAMEVDLHSLSHEHEDEVERMRQDVMTAVSAIRANEGQHSDTQLSDRVQLLSKQAAVQRDVYRRFLEQLRGQVCGSDKDTVLDLLDKQLKDIGTDTTPLTDADFQSPTASHPSPASPLVEDKARKMEQELELLKKEKDEALAEETRNTKAALDAMRKAYEEELQQERSKYRESLLTMYSEDIVHDLKQRHRLDVEKTKVELKQVKSQYLSKCEALKMLELKMGQTKQDHEAHINQLLLSNTHLDEMVTQQINQLKETMKRRSGSQSSTSATMEEELYDAQITVRVKDTELQKLRVQVKNMESSLHRTTEEHRQTMTQYLQALKENQELRKEYHTETAALQDQLDRTLSEAGVKRPVRRVPSLKNRTRSPSPGMTAQRPDCVSNSAEHGGQHKSTDLKDLRRSRSSPSLPLVFNAKGSAMALKLPSKRDRRFSQKI